MQNGFESQTPESLEQYGIAEGSENNTLLSRFAKLACDIFDVPAAVIMVVEEERVWPVAGHGSAIDVPTTYEQALYRNIATSDNIYSAEDASLITENLHHSEMQASSGLQLYAGCPLRAKSGFAIGVFCLMDNKQRQFSEPQVTRFSLLSSLLMDHFEKLYQQNNLIAANKAKISALAHDLKNPLTIVTLQAELLMDENNATDDIIEMSQQISVAGRKINDIINKRLFS